MITESDAFDTVKAFKVVLRILDKWQASPEESIKLLGLNQTELQAACQTVKDGKPITFKEDTHLHLGCILQIHQSLRVVFSNSDNIYGFMKMINNNPFFDGKTPMEVATEGGLQSLLQTLNYIRAKGCN